MDPNPGTEFIIIQLDRWYRIEYTHTHTLTHSAITGSSTITKKSISHYNTSKNLTIKSSLDQSNLTINNQLTSNWIDQNSIRDRSECVSVQHPPTHTISPQSNEPTYSNSLSLSTSNPTNNLIDSSKKRNQFEQTPRIQQSKIVKISLFSNC